MNVLSLFDGISCGQVALNRIGIKPKIYFASEIDKHAIKITQKNYPDTIQLGDINEYENWMLPKIDLIMGGSPCQGFSFAGKQLNFEDPRSKLIFKFFEVLEFYKPKYFLLENVRMKKEYQDIISKYLGCEPVCIESSLLTAQNRSRLYWTDIPEIFQPRDRNIYWKDIQIENCDNVYYVTEKMFKWIYKSQKRKDKFKVYKNTDNLKMQMVEAGHGKLISNQRCFAIQDTRGLRYISVVECERLQTLPDKYTEGISNTQRYRSIGNGWTVDVIAHILKSIGE